jgi:hypothetical protein
MKRTEDLQQLTTPRLSFRRTGGVATSELVSFLVFLIFKDYLHPAETEFQGTRNGDERNAPRLISLPPVGISASPHAPPQTEIFCSLTKLRRGGGGKLICWRQLTKATRSVSFLDFGPLLLRLRLRPGGEAAKGGDDAE